MVLLSYDTKVILKSKSRFGRVNVKVLQEVRAVATRDDPKVLIVAL